MNPDLARLFIAYRRGQISYEDYMKGVAALEAAKPTTQEPTGYSSPSAPAPEGAFKATPTREEYRPNAMGQPYYGMDEPAPPMGQEQRFRPMPQPTSARVVQAARQVLPAAQAAPAQQQQPERNAPNALMRLVRGDFREGADQRVMEAMRRQREESGVTEQRASGGQVESKKASRDDVLHKALEIIHHILTRR